MLFVLLLCAFCAFLSSEEADERDILLSASYRVKTLEEIERIYKALPAEHDDNYGFDRDRYFIWALSNFIFDRVFCGEEKPYNADFNSVEEFQEKFAHGLNEITSRLYAYNPEIMQIARLVVLAQAKYAFHFKTRDPQHPAREQIRKATSEYRERVDLNTSPALRESLALLIGTRLASTHYTGCKQSIGPSAIFLLADFNRIRYTPQSAPNTDWVRFHQDCPITPIFETNVERAKVMIDEDFHPTMLFYDGAPRGPFFSTNAKLRGYHSNSGICEDAPIMESYFVATPNFLSHHYASSHLLSQKDFHHDGKIVDFEFNIGHQRVYSDIRTLHVKGEYNVCRKSRELLDKHSPYYNRLIRLAAMCDNPNACYDSEMWDKIPVKFLPDFARYDEYLKQCDVYLAAYFPRTIKSSILASQGEIKKTSSFLSPDFSIEPLIYPVFIPDELLRYTAHAGVHRTLFTYNAMGIGDITTSYPSE